jgi:hypothetical protein
LQVVIVSVIVEDEPQQEAHYVDCVVVGDNVDGDDYNHTHNEDMDTDQPI